MRRGLISWSESEVSRATLESRLARVRSAMRDAQLDALLVYTNIARPSGVTYLAQFVPYWSHGLLLVLPGAQPPALIVALSKRVSGWIEETSYISAVTSTPDVGAAAARAIRLAQAASARIGVVELDRVPAEVVASLTRGLNGSTLEDATTLFEAVRAAADEAELALARHAVSIVSRAFEAARRVTAVDAAALIAVLDGECRRLGAEEVLVTLAPNLDDDLRLRRVEGHTPLGMRRAVRLSLAYKGQWIRVTRTLCEEANDRQRAADLQAWLKSALATVRPGDGAQKALQARVSELPGLTLLDCTWHGARNGLPLACLRKLTAGALVNADLCVRFHEQQWRLGEPLQVAHSANETARLLGG